jgi:tetratricopeptide (TPR) repeat protein
MLVDAAAGGAVAEQLEAIGDGTKGAAGVRILAFLLESREETAARIDARRRWWRHAVARSKGRPPVPLAVLVQGAVDLRDEMKLWEAAERAGRERGELATVVRAYGQALTGKGCDPKLAEALGRRMVALEVESAVPAQFFVEVLESVLEHAPGARWALDRVKLAIGEQGRWDALFRLYDRAIADAAERPAERAALYDEAAFAARDLANDAERAITYLRAIHALRPEDPAIATALERLCEREGKKDDLIALLGERAGRSKGAERRELQRRVAALWLEVGKPDDAGRALEAAIADGMPVADVADLLENVAMHPGQGRAIDRLCAYYESVGRMTDAVRIAEAAPKLTDDSRQRTARMRELVSVRVRAAQGTPGVFARVVENISTDVANDPTLAKVAYRAALGHAVLVLEEAPTDEAAEDASMGASLAIAALKQVYLDAGDPKGAIRLLVRTARLPFERRRQRALLHQAALLCTEQPDEQARAIRLINEIFQEQSNDTIAAALLDRYVALLDAAGDRARLAAVWEDQARHRATAGSVAEACACWERAATLWGGRSEWERAILAHEQGAALGSEASYGALARIHAARGQWPEAVRALEWLCTRAA